VIAEVTPQLADHLLARNTEIGSNWIEIASLESGATRMKDRLRVFSTPSRNARIGATRTRSKQR
jgi:hypothetical protein